MEISGKKRKKASPPPSSNGDPTRPVKRRGNGNVKRRRSNSKSEHIKNNDDDDDGRKTMSIPVFTDAFLDLFREQKSEIRSLKFKFNELTERFKLKDAEQEQIRLNNQKMRVDIDEIAEKNSLLRNLLMRIDNELEETFARPANNDLIEYLHEHCHDQSVRNQMEKLVHSLQL